MQNDSLKEMCQSFVRGELDADRFLAQCLATTSAQTENATLDLDRAARCGFPEVIFGEGKSITALRETVSKLVEHGQPVLVTRVSPEQAESILELIPDVRYNELARTLRFTTNENQPQVVGKVAVITAGTSDRPIAEEACETLLWMGVATVIVRDVGVAGPHRLPSQLEKLQGIDAAVVAAGMEGALPSVVGGYVSCPVVAVPTSVGYGASFQGVAALLGMLNSCAANVTVVNIDAGFKAGYVAGLIARQKYAARPVGE